MRSITILALALALLALPVRAEGRRDNADELKGDSDFRGCLVSAGVYNIRDYRTRFIDSGRGTDRQRAIALSRRAAVRYDAIEATTDLDRAIRLDASYAPAYLARGRLFGRQGDLERGLADLGRAIDLEDASGQSESDGRSVEAFYERGRLYEKRGELERAIADYGRVTRFADLAPKIFRSFYPEAYFRCGSLNERLGRHDEAIANYRRGAALASASGMPHRDTEEALKRLSAAP